MQLLTLNDNTVRKVTALLTLVGKSIHSNQSDPLWRTIHDEKRFKTGGDLEADRMLVKGFNKITPDIPVFSEEHLHTIKDRPAVYWLIDPIDGTSSWYNGFDGYVSQLALVNDNVVAFAAIYWPSRDKMFIASASGVFINGKVLTRPILNESIILIDNYPLPTGVAEYLIGAMPKMSYQECGSLGLKSVLALTGLADLFVKDVLVRDWDMAPAIAFANKLGGRVSNFIGQPLELGHSIEFKKGLVVSHDPVLVDGTINCLKKFRA